MFNKFKKIEEEYAVEDIVYKNEKVWSYLRVFYHQESIKKITENYANSKKVNFFKKSIQTLGQIFYGFSNWFKKYNYMFFGDPKLRLKNNNIWVDRSFGVIIETLGEENCLYIDTPNPKHIKINKLDTRYIVSKRLVDIVILVVYKLSLKKKIKIDLLDRINKKENLIVDYSESINRFNITTKIYKLLFYIYKPKAVFINCYYSHQAMIKAANEMNIKTIEIQHGMIGKEHFAYNLNKELNSSFFPKKLLTFGNYDKNIIENSKFNPFDKLYVVGSLTLELIKKQKIPENLLKLTKQYKKTISVSTQYTVEDELAFFIKEIASKNKSIGYFLSLRHFDKNYYTKFNLPNNVHLIENEYSCYDVLKVSDIHLTSYSTCGLEALFFKKTTLLVNINNNLFTTSLANVNSSNIFIIQSSNEFFDVINNKYMEEKLIFWNNYQKNIISFLSLELRK